MTQRYLKFTYEDSRTRQQGFNFTGLAKSKKWSPERKRVVECRSGWHATHVAGASSWLNETCYVVELGEKRDFSGEKVASNKIRFVRKTAYSPLRTWRILLTAIQCGLSADKSATIDALISKNKPSYKDRPQLMKLVNSQHLRRALEDFIFFDDGVSLMSWSLASVFSYLEGWAGGTGRKYGVSVHDMRCMILGVRPDEIATTFQYVK